MPLKLLWIVRILAVLSLITGLYASSLWLKASKYKIKHSWEPDIEAKKNKDVYALIDTLSSLQLGTVTTVEQSNKFNQDAAKYTALSVAFSALSSLASSFI